jgi:hypothetical protein
MLLKRVLFTTLCWRWGQGLGFWPRASTSGSWYARRASMTRMKGALQSSCDWRPIGLGSARYSRGFELLAVFFACSCSPEQLAMPVEDSFVKVILTGRGGVAAAIDIRCRRHDFEDLAKLVGVRSFA